MKRISDEKIDKAMEYAMDWAQDYTTRNGKPEPIPERQVAQTQLDSCEKEHDEIVREIFEEVERHARPMVNDTDFDWYMALKNKYPGDKDA